MFLAGKLTPSDSDFELPLAPGVGMESRSPASSGAINGISKADGAWPRAEAGKMWQGGLFLVFLRY